MIHQSKHSLKLLLLTFLLFSGVTMLLLDKLSGSTPEEAVPGPPPHKAKRSSSPAVAACAQPLDDVDAHFDAYFDALHVGDDELAQAELSSVISQLEAHARTSDSESSLLAVRMREALAYLVLGDADACETAAKA